MEILSLLGGALSGFIFRMMAQHAADRAAQFKMWIDTVKSADDSADAATKRTPNDSAGNNVRRLIVIAVLFGVILAPFVLAMMGKPVIVQIDLPVKNWFGIIPTGGKTKFYELGSYLLIPEVRQSLMAIIGYYFGQSAVTKR